MASVLQSCNATLPCNLGCDPARAGRGPAGVIPANSAPVGGAPSVLTRAALIGAALAFAVAVAVLVGVRYGLLILIGLGFGITLEGFRFGFAGPWRRMITERDPGGLLGHLLAIGLVAVVAIPLLAASGPK